MVNPLAERRAGILLHPTSLPGAGRQGSLGTEAYGFVDFLSRCGISVWQMLPLGPTHNGDSPYQCLSVHAGNPALICREDLVARGWLDADDIHSPDNLQSAGKTFRTRASEADREEYANFRKRHAYWLDDYALYQAIRQTQGAAAWLDWPPPLRNRHRQALAGFRKEHAEAIDQTCFEQFVFFVQWQQLRDYARQRGIVLFGDMPIFVAHDSADVWAARQLFSTDNEGNLLVVSGVPPDYFSATGQRWGNPLYQWRQIMTDDFRWWLDRFRTQQALFDLIRLDHFRGFEKYWEIPAESETAVNGRWVEAPGDALFTRLLEEFGELPLVAEDLGTITPEVEAMRRRYRLPGMKILQFAFDDGPGNPYLPHNHEVNSVIYTGTHDNDTTLGWFNNRDAAGRQAVYEYLGNPAENMPWPLVRAALASVGRLAILPMQDILALGSEHRMNTPGTSGNNWRWRFSWKQIPPDLPGHLHRLVCMYGRCRN